MYQPPPQQPPQWQQQQLQQQADLNRSYVAAAWLSAALAFLFVVPGLIAVIINLTEAAGVKKRTGVTPQGYGCLWAVLIWCLLPLIIGAFILASIVTGLAAAGTAVTSIPTQSSSAPGYQPDTTTPFTSTDTPDTQSQQQAVDTANNTVSTDISSLQGNVSSLNQSATFDSVFTTYAQGWQQMQTDYQTEVNNSKNGCAEGNLGLVQGDAGVVQGDEGVIQGDDGVFDGQKNTIGPSYNATQQGIVTLKNDWQTLKQAVANNPSGGSNYQQSDIDSAVSSGNNALDNADSVIKKAKGKRATYDDEASMLNKKAQALPGKMGC
jgi:hypothetical protein